ncbi:hypothetical protein EDD85DRAFT_946094 [Armillaria nabsnona]|nr:hypothetical protein EDD85DRAFT_946094 [Armillaria nabsnona]
MESPPADLPQDDRDLIFETLDMDFNRTILQSLLQAITLWTIFSTPKKSGNSFLLTVVITLYILTTVDFGVSWAYGLRAFIQNGDNFFTVFIALQAVGPWLKAYQLVSSISGGISTFIVDITVIWRCWVLWGRRWLIVLIPGLCAIAGIIAKSMQIRGTFIDTGNNGGSAAFIDWTLIYLSLTLATTLLCTLLIVYCIVRLASGVSSYGKIVEIVVESSAMYSLTLIVYLALVTRNLDSSMYYTDTITAYIKVIAPTLLIGRVAAGSNSNPGSQAIVNSTRDRSSVLSRFIVRKWETVVVCRDAEDSMTSMGSYGKHGREIV